MWIKFARLVLCIHYELAVENSSFILTGLSHVWGESEQIQFYLCDCHCVWVLRHAQQTSFQARDE